MASQIRPMRNLILSRTANSARRTQILQTTLPRSSTLNEYQELRICVSKKGASIVFENSAVWSNWLPSFIITHNSKEITLKFSIYLKEIARHQKKGCYDCQMQQNCRIFKIKICSVVTIWVFM